MKTINTHKILVNCTKKTNIYNNNINNFNDSNFLFKIKEFINNSRYHR